MVDDFFDGAEKMREVYDARFRTPRVTSGDRFVWDFWYIPDQYSYLRTPGQNFFLLASTTTSSAACEPGDLPTSVAPASFVRG